MDDVIDEAGNLSSSQRDERNPLRADRGARPPLGLRFAGRPRSTGGPRAQDSHADRIQSLGIVRDANVALSEALCRHIGLPQDTPVRSLVLPWVSATFSGMRHELVFELASDRDVRRAKAFAARVGEAEFDLPGHIVADIQARLADPQAGNRDNAQCASRLQVEALTVVSA